MDLASLSLSDLRAEIVSRRIALDNKLSTELSDSDQVITDKASLLIDAVCKLDSCIQTLEEIADLKIGILLKVNSLNYKALE